MASETTTVQSTTAAQTTTTAQATTINLTTVEIPQTGETSSNNNAILIGLLLLALAGSLTFVVYRSKPVKE